MAADPITKNTVDQLLTYNFSDDEDPFGQQAPTKQRDDKATLSPRAPKRRLNDDDKENFGRGLGLDEEVKIVKKRKPMPRLDEARLLSQPGLPKLRALATSGRISSKLRLKGKGHEFSDASKLLSYYQLWLDNLYPRAKFLDGLQLVEKAGHSKTLQRQRRDWIDEGKPGYIRDRERRKDGGDSEAGILTTEGFIENDVQSGLAQATSPASDEDAEPGLFVPETNAAAEPEEPDEDELDALLAGQGQPNPTSAERRDVASEDEDDLDALLAEHNARTAKQANLPPKTTNSVAEPEQEEDEDDLDALLNEYHTSHATLQSKPNDVGDPGHTADVAALGPGKEETESMEQPQEQSTATQQASTPSPPHHDTNTPDDALHQESNTSILPLSSPVANDVGMEFESAPSASEKAMALTATLVHDETSMLRHDDDLDLFSSHAMEEDDLMLPEPRLLNTPSKNDDSQGHQSVDFLSSSPMPNDVMEMEDLDALMDGRKN